MKTIYTVITPQNEIINATTLKGAIDRTPLSYKYANRLLQHSDYVLIKGFDIYRGNLVNVKNRNCIF